jgi:hypothetical protein
LVAPHGEGAYLVCQLKAVSKADQEPAAGVLLRNLVDYAAAYPPPPKATALYCDDPDARRKLDELRVQADEVTGRLSTLDLSRYSLLIYGSPSAGALVAELNRVVPWVEAGGSVLIHGLAPEEYGKLAEVLDPTVRLVPYRGHALRNVGEAPLLSAFANEDLYWLGEHTGISWSTTPLAQTTATAAFERTLRREDAREFPAADMALTGTIVGKNEGGDGVFFATVGSGSLLVDFPTAGEYVVGVVARGTDVNGVYPIGDVRVGGQALGSLSVRSNEWELYTTFGHVEAGKHTVEVAFVNDGNSPTQDRNMYVQSLLVAPAEAGGRSLFLTQPAGLAQFPHGKGSFVVDNLTWDTEEENRTKATRFISGLLTGLGARFRPRLGVNIEAEDMEPQPGMQHFSRGGGRVIIATAGYIDAEVEVARAGRYRAELVAGGSAAEGEYPQVEVRLGEQVLGTVQLTTGSMKPYVLETDLAAGMHVLRVTFTNDRNTAGEDRNLYVDRVTFYGPE